MSTHTAHSVEQCIENCLRCHRICLEVAGRHFNGKAVIEAGLLRTVLDCAEICEISASFMIRGSDLHGETCAACATICDRCADECDRRGDDPHMAACAEICRRCAESCREMAAASGQRQ
jgi:hypothetical protein